MGAGGAWDRARQRHASSGDAPTAQAWRSDTGAQILATLASAWHRCGGKRPARTGH